MVQHPLAADEVLQFLMRVESCHVPLFDMSHELRLRNPMLFASRVVAKSLPVREEAFRCVLRRRCAIGEYHRVQRLTQDARRATMLSQG